MATNSTRWTDHIVTSFAWDDAIEDLYDSWLRRVAAAERGHRLIAARLRRRHLVLGGLVALPAALIATAAFASLRGTEASIDTRGLDPDGVLLAVGSVAALTVILAGLQTFLRSSSEAEGHRIAAVRYEMLRWDMATTLATPREARNQPDLTLTATRLRMDRYGGESPIIGERLWRKLEHEFSLSSVPPEPARRGSAIVIPEAPPAGSGRIT
ncbi:MAG TPA: SLATT domain-containing protein [Actinomycetota bacterium]